MALSATIKHWLLASALIYILVFACESGKADEYLPGTGVTGGTGVTRGTGVGGLPQTGASGSGAGRLPQTGAAGGDPASIVTEALLCFSQKYIYSSCSEAYRLTESGNLNVPPEYVDQYCNGQCVTETHLVLNCLENILSHFVFYNKATIVDVRETIKEGCSHGPQRGDFNVAEHIEAENSSSHKASNPVLFWLVLITVELSFFL
ncbi:unnamed protein product [Ilex paraguariensis]|uniref:DUF7731 domain-containing protein n=1 Tax=Ilex paraguariensis TaxID=185542 RepID=A0ABC8R2G1_9AQUA